MTFVDAAVEVLKREGKPLTIRRLAELAVKHNLLSVVGRDPESTMQQRLDEAMTRTARHPDLVRVSGDTFGLRAYPDQPYPAKGEKPAAGGSTAAGGGEAAAAEGGDAAKKGRRRRRRGRRGADSGGENDVAEAGDEGESGANGAAAEAADAAEGEGEGAAAETASAEVAGEGAAGEGAAGEGAKTEAAEAPNGEKRRRRRRGGRGRRRREGEGAAAGEEGGADEAADDAGDDEAGPAAAQASDAAVETPEAAATPAALVAASAVEAEAEPAGDVGEEPDEAEAELVTAEASPPLPDELPSEAEAAGGPAEAGEDFEDAEDEIDADFDHDTGPVLAPAHGAEDVTRTDDDRVVRPEIRGTREDRHRRDHRDRHKDRRDRHKDDRQKGQEHKAQEHKGQEHKGQEHKGQEHKPHDKAGHEPRPQLHDKPQGATHPHKGPPPAAEAGGDKGPRPAGVVEAALEVLRGSEGRPLPARQLVDTALQKRLLDARTPAADWVRLVRAALVRDVREREAEGTRPRVRAAGGGQFAGADKRIEPDLLQAERELTERAGRVREATRAAIRRRVGRMTPAAFEALGRTLCDKLGLSGLELIRRGEGVSYWGGTRAAGVATVRTLVALRPSEAEINRRAVGELRAGLAAKGFDEGLLLGGGTPNAEALTELKSGVGVTLYDGGALAQLLIKHGLGIKRAMVPVDYLDLEFFSELTDG